MSLQHLLGKSCKATTGAESNKPAHLGRNELGWYAYEQRMPARLLKMHQHEDVEHGTSGIIDVLRSACERDDSVECAYLCHPSVQYIGKLRWEGSFCGYRNIQMLVSCIVGAQIAGFEHFETGIPSVLRIQDLIEEAWDKGINSDGRIETGGIKGTRKHIGTPEVQALFTSLEINCRTAAYADTAAGPKACELLVLFTQQYFSAAATVTPAKGVHQTNLPPIYLQRPRHSLTIVGYATKKDGSCDLLVFDPGLAPSADMRRAVENRQHNDNQGEKSARALLAPYHLSKRRLGRYKNFETMVLTDR